MYNAVRQIIKRTKLSFDDIEGAVGQSQLVVAAKRVPILEGMPRQRRNTILKYGDNRGKQIHFKTDPWMKSIDNKLNYLTLVPIH